MKNSILISSLVILLSVVGQNISLAGNPKYKLTAENVKLVSSNVYEFDIYLQHVNSGETKFEYVLGQFFFDFNSEIANGGTLTYSIIGSDLPQSLQPRNPTVSGNQLRLAVNSVPPKENLPLISSKSPGTLIAKMRLATSSKSFSDAGLNLKLRSGPENPFTKIFAFIENQIVDITNKDEFSADKISGEESTASLPNEFSLSQNYPNPFNPSTSINYVLPVNGHVSLNIYDVAGREIATLVNDQQSAGNYSVNFDGSSFASGVYFYRLVVSGANQAKSGNFTQVRKMLLIK
ncbi:MAG: hypothetical protein HGGPFJEG_01174 [Ignavibacteria bacterium]|nr:hypothetical protein [Ignavibacteria bacterium]